MPGAGGAILSNWAALVVAKETGRRALVHQGAFVEVVGNGETLISGVLCPSSGSGSFLAVAAAVAAVADGSFLKGLLRRLQSHL